MSKLASFIGTGGHTHDEEFKTIIDLIDSDDNLVMVDENFEEAFFTSLVTEIYEHKETKERYELWYQIRTPESLSYMEFAFGFDRAK